MPRVLFAVLGVLLALPAAASQPAANKLKALLVTGGGYHDYKKLNPILVEKIPQLANVSIDVKYGLDTLKNPKFADGYDVILYNFCFADAKNSEIIDNALKAIRAGKPAVMIHCAMHTFMASDEWTDACGMRTRRHDPYRPFSIIKTVQDHPATNVLPGEWRTTGDELYQTIKLGPRSTALLKGKADKVKEDHIVCWVSTYGKGKVFATTLGHDLKTVNMPEFQKLLANGILWACDKLNREGRPLPGYGGSKANPAPAPQERAPEMALFPDKLLGEGVKDAKMTGAKPNRRVSEVSRPTITVYRPAKDRDTGAAVVIAPGGGYSVLAWDHEGEEVAQWLNQLGITGVVLKYRIPRRADHPKAPLADAQRAISLVRSKAREWGLDPNRIGMLGFSAGGHLTAVTATNGNQRAYEPFDAADKFSCRPDFAVVVYPGGVTAKGNKTLVPDVRVSKNAPPTFLVHSGDDKVSAENSVLFYLALKQAGVPAELHIYSGGGHGYGLNRSKYAPAAQWPRRCEEWLRARGVLKAASGS